MSGSQVDGSLRVGEALQKYFANTFIDPSKGLIAMIVQLNCRHLIFCKMNNDFPVNPARMVVPQKFEPPRINIDTSSLMRRADEENKAHKSTNYLAEFQRASLASEFAKSLLFSINQFNDGLDHEKEVGIKLVSFGQAVTFHVSDVGYHNPSLIVFYGLTEDGDRVELMQHVSQISFLLIALPKLNPEEPRRPIGFISQ